MEFSRRSLAGLVLALMLGCHAGGSHGPETACDEQTPCRSPLVCIDRRCQSTDSSATGDSATSDAATSDADTRGDTATSDADAGGDTAGATDAGADADVADAGERDVDERDAHGPEVAKPPGDPDHPPTMFVFATTDIGSIWLLNVLAGSVAGPGGSIFSVGADAVQIMEVTARAGTIGLADDVETQAIGQVVHLLVRQGTDVYATSVSGDSWAARQHVAGGMVAMGLANLDGEAWACLVDGDGQLHLAVRGDAGDWQDMGDVMSAASAPAGQGAAPHALTKVDCAGIGTDLQILALDAGGVIWQAVKRRSGWSPFKALSETLGVVFEDVDVSNAVGELHILGSDRFHQFHALRTAEGAWQGFADIEANVGDPKGHILAGAQTSALSEVDWFQVNSLGQLWICSRFRYLPTPYLLLRDRAPDGHGFVSVSATAVLPY